MTRSFQKPSRVKTSTLRLLIHFGRFCIYRFAGCRAVFASREVGKAAEQKQIWSSVFPQADWTRLQILIQGTFLVSIPPILTYSSMLSAGAAAGSLISSASSLFHELLEDATRNLTGKSEKNQSSGLHQGFKTPNVGHARNGNDIQVLQQQLNKLLASLNSRIMDLFQNHGLDQHTPFRMQSDPVGGIQVTNAGPLNSEIEGILSNDSQVVSLFEDTKTWARMLKAIQEKLPLSHGSSFSNQNPHSERESFSVIRDGQSAKATFGILK